MYDLRVSSYETIEWTITELTVSSSYFVASIPARSFYERIR
jgi:hypothetical protein